MSSRARRTGRRQAPRPRCRMRPARGPGPGSAPGGRDWVAGWWVAHSWDAPSMAWPGVPPPQSAGASLRALLRRVKFCKDGASAGRPRRYRAAVRVVSPAALWDYWPRFQDRAMNEAAVTHDSVAAPGGAALVAALGARSIVLVGMMGSGKSSIGRRLAARLAVSFCAADSGKREARRRD